MMRSRDFEYGKGKKRILICGAGHQGLSMAAHFALNGEDVSLWNRSVENVRDIINTGKIHCSGIVNGEAEISRVSTSMADVICDFIMVTTPSTAHRDIARQLAPFVHEEMIIVLNPGRTFGAIEFAEELQKCGAKSIPNIAETQTIVYTCRKSGPNSASILALKNDVEIAVLKGGNVYTVLDMMPECIKRHFKPVCSVALTSLSNVGMILHCAPVMMNVGWVECEKVDFKYYYDGISRSVANFLEKLDAERRAVAKACGFEVESIIHWMKRTYGITGRDLFECIRNNMAYREIDAPPTINSRYVFEDVPNGLVPIETLGKELGVQTPNISTIVSLASSVMEVDYRTTGRQYTYDLLEQYF